MTETIRLNKYLASCGVESRRKADELIIQGRVKINGKLVLTPGVVINEDSDKVLVDGKPVRPAKHQYAVFNKPAGYITSKKDTRNRKTIYDILPDEFKKLKTAGRLDKDSSGLLIMTNDGDMLQKLMHPTIKVPKYYRVTAEGKLNKSHLIEMKKGIEIEDNKVAYADSMIVGYENSNTVLEMILYQGYNRQIRKMLAKLGFPVISLKRTAHGCIQLAGLEKGNYKYLKPKEVQDLKNYLNKFNCKK